MYFQALAELTNTMLWLEEPEIVKFMVGVLSLADRNGVVDLDEAKLAAALKMRPNAFTELLKRSSEYVNQTEEGFQTHITFPKRTSTTYVQRYRERKRKLEQSAT